MFTKLNNIQIFTLLVLVGFASCDKVETEVQDVNFEVENLKEGGDDDEDPIVQGKVVNAQSNPINGARVDIYEENGIFPVDSMTTGSSGLFEFQVPEGNYFLMVTVPGRNPVSSDVFTLDSNVYIEVEVQ